MLKTYIQLFAAALAPLTVGVTFAQEFPTKNVRMIVSFPAGGANEPVTRLVAEKASEIWAKPVIVEFRGGASGNIAASAVHRSPPDGHTLLVIGGSYFTNPAVSASMPFDALKDLIGVTPMAASGMMLVANPSLPVKSVKELIGLAKRNPGKLTFASSGTGGSLHLCGELLNVMAGISMLHVPYKGGGPALIDVIAGQVDLMFSGVTPTLPHIGSGRLRALATAGAKRNPSLPDVPTIQDSGVPGFVVDAHIGILAPAATPREVVNRLNATFVQVLQTADVKERLARFGVEAISSTPGEYARYIAAEIAKWQKLVKAAGIRMNECGAGGC